MPRLPLPRWSGNYHHIPYVVHGRDESGVDCWGLVRLVYLEQFNIELPCLADRYEHTRFEDAKTLASVVNDVKQEWFEIPYAQREVGDVIVMRYAGEPMHVGIVVSEDTMLHARCNRGVGLTVYDSLENRNRIAGFYRHALNR